MKKAYISPKVKTIALQLENAAMFSPESGKTQVTDGVSGGGYGDKPEINEEGTGEDV